MPRSKKFLAAIVFAFMMVLIGGCASVEAASLGSFTRPVTSETEMATAIRRHLVKRDRKFRIYKSFSPKDVEASFEEAVIGGTGTVNGEYLTWSYPNGTWKDYPQYTDFSCTYDTSAKQEKYVSKKVRKIVRRLKLRGKSKEKKARSLYRWVIKHIEYDDDLTNYSAYAALRTGKATCNGYALLYYRLCKEAGVPCHIVVGKALGRYGWENHSWNIVKISGKWYYCDPTWEAASLEKGSKYFLKCDLRDHMIEDGSIPERWRCRNTARIMRRIKRNLAKKNR